jgi:serine O-acetyltransferase
MSQSHQSQAGPASKNPEKLCAGTRVDLENVWESLRGEARRVIAEEPALGARLARRLAREDMPRTAMEPLFTGVLTFHPHLVHSAMRDLLAMFDRDPACFSVLEPLLFFKGYMALSSYRISHQLWQDGRRWLALYLQSVVSETFAVDIHPAARIGCGILLDHATSFVVGETAIIEDDVSILHEVTLGGTGKDTGDRHPIVRSGVLLGAGAKILGRVEIGTGAKVGAGSVVLSDVPPHTTVAGVPAVIVGEASEQNPAIEMNQNLECRIPI